MIRYVMPRSKVRTLFLGLSPNDWPFDIGGVGTETSLVASPVIPAQFGAPRKQVAARIVVAPGSFMGRPSIAVGDVASAHVIPATG